MGLEMSIKSVEETLVLNKRAVKEIKSIRHEPETYKAMICDAMANLSYLVDSSSSEADLKSAADVLTSLRMYWELIEKLAECNEEGGSI